MFSQDFLNETFIDVMSPQTLYFYRATNKYTYHYITMDKIKNKIIYNIHTQLKLRLGNKYDLYVHCMQKRQLLLHGPFINECIWEEYHDADIEFYIWEKDMGTEDDNIFKDLNFKDADMEYRNIISYFNFEYNWIYEQDNVTIETRSSYNIIDWDIYPELFRCTYNNIVELPYLLSIMHKKLAIYNNAYYDYQDDPENYEDCIVLCNKYKVKVVDNYRPKIRKKYEYVIIF